MLTRTKNGLITYRHSQTQPSSSWSVNHQLGAKPLVDVMLEIDGSFQKAFPAAVTHTDDNNVVITWSVPRVGKVVLTSVVIP